MCINCTRLFFELVLIKKRDKNMNPEDIAETPKKSKQPKEEKQKTFLFIQVIGLGDIVVASQACQDIKRFYRNSKIIFIVPENLVQAAQGIKEVDEVYGFDKNGALVKGLSVWHNGEYVTTINTDDTNAKDFIISGSYIAKNGDREVLSDDYNLHYFDSRGRRVTT